MSLRSLDPASLTIEARPISVGRDFEVFTGSLADRPVAIKVARDPSREPQLEAEAAALGRVAAEGIAPIALGLVRLADQRLALVRTWVDGLSLATLVERALVRHRWQGARRWNGATRALFTAVLDAVERLHRAGLVHNDLKPDDVLVVLEPDGRFRASLLDLGLAARPGRGGPGGTVAYAAPERLDGEPGTVRSDIWSLGAILFELCAGTRAYPSDHPVDARLERREPIEHATRSALSHAWRSFPPALQAGLAAALAPDPARRPRSVPAWRALLELDPRRAPGPTSSPSPVPIGRRRSYLWAAALAATALGAALAWGPGSRALGLGTAGGDCGAMMREAERLCRDRGPRSAECVRALTATPDCDARARLLAACGGAP